MKIARISLAALAACAVLGSLASSQVIVGFRCSGIVNKTVSCIVPTAPTCHCRAGFAPVYDGNGQQVSVVSWCRQAGNCP